MRAQHEMRRQRLREYLVFRVKLIEFLDIVGLWRLLKERSVSSKTPVPRTCRDFADSLRTPLLSWFALFIDKNGMNVIELWKELFPSHSAEIDAAWNRMKPAWDILRTFRDRAGFHGDKPLRFFNARREILVRQNRELIDQALVEFQKLQVKILAAESSELRDLPQAVDEFLTELETDHGHSHYNRQEFKRYLMIPGN